MNEQHTPQGWYQDGQDPTMDRWWDGTRWTGATRPRVAPGAVAADQRAPIVVAPAPPKKRHRVRNAALIVVGVIVLISIIQGITGGDDTDTPATTSQENGGEAQDAGLGLGDAAEDGDFTFVVESVEDGPERIGTDTFGTSPQGRFVYVTVTVTNHGDEAGSFFGDNQYLVDTEGRKASADTEAAVYLPESQSLYEEINPGNTLTGTVVFDIPADAVPAAVELHDSLFSGGVTVDLS
ncbi:DUF4352 domain-containing protein [Jiangella muralis]|uniref:DUF4352 domain-containing protein n=1 Tax=Jiangella muralis TaxID=702383 RepID=UPI00069FE994|nr:DUF4352 domain-containing protein [Jiangella muralis]